MNDIGRVVSIIGVVGALVAGLTAAAPAARAGELTIVVSGVKSNQHRVYVAVHQVVEGVKFPKPAGMVAGIWRKAKNGGFTVTITGLAPGRYAVNGFHDTNGNGKLDTNVLGAPKEGFGFGNGASGRFGPPGFKASSVAVGAGAATIKLPFRYR